MAGPDLRAIHDIQMTIQASSLGPALHPAYSFYSVTEVSEYVPDEEQYTKILRDREKLDPASRHVQSQGRRLQPSGWVR